MRPGVRSDRATGTADGSIGHLLRPQVPVWEVSIPYLAWW